MILIDSNTPMYLVGSKHRHKADSNLLLDDLVACEERLATYVEVLQEILHRYTVIGRPDAIQSAFDALLNIVDEVFPTASKNWSTRSALCSEITGCRHEMRSILP